MGDGHTAAVHDTGEQCILDHSGKIEINKRMGGQGNERK